MLLIVAAWVGCAGKTDAGPEPPASTGHTGAETTAAHSAENPTGGPTATTADTGAETVPFVAVFTAEVAGDAVAVRTSVPMREADCASIPGAPCGDTDLDGLTDAWEDGVLDHLRPTLVFDEAEPLVGDPSAVLAIVARVAPAAGDRVHVYLMLGYSVDYGRCGLSGHDGDSERVVLELAPDGGVGDVAVTAVYTAAHENTPNDHGHRYTGADLATLSFPADPEPRLQVWSSDGKHATYGTAAACESASFVPCVEEDCSPDRGVDPLDFTVLPAAFNAGEPTAPRLTDLAGIGFPDEDAWASQDFCGGRGRGGSCSAPVRDKLLDDPF